MPRSGYYQQKCPCGKDHRAKASISISASTLGVLPRVKSKTVTVYICTGCIRSPKPKTRKRMFEAMMGSAKTIAKLKGEND